MNGSLQFQYEKFNVQVNSLARELKVSVPVVLKDEARRWLQQAIRLTPPTRGRLPGGEKHTDRAKSKTALATGENAVRGDVIRAMTPADPDWAHGFDFFKKPAMRKLILSGNKEGFMRVISRIPAFKNWRVENFSPQLHQRARGSRGHVRTAKKIFIIGNSQLTEFWRYLTRQVSHVGRLKAGFAVSLLELGGKGVPAFVRRHIAGARGRMTQNLSPQTPHPFIEVTNFAIGTGNADMQRLALQITKARNQAMKRRMALLRDGFHAGSVARIKAARTNREDI